jgi:hypothetical protein
MLAADSAYRREFDSLARTSAITAVHVLDDLAAHPEKWRAHRPGVDAWRGPVHPLGWHAPVGYPPQSGKRKGAV